MVDVMVSARTAAHPSGTALDGVYVALHTSGGTYLASGTSGEGGNDDGMVFLGARAAGTYEVRITPLTGVVRDGCRHTLTVAADDTGTLVFDILVDTTEVTPADDARLCRLTGVFRDVSGRPHAYCSFTFSEKEVPPLLDYSGVSVGVLPGAIRARSDATGFVSVDLIRGATYAVEVGPIANTILQIVVPDSELAPLPDVLFPVVDRLEWKDENDDYLTPTAAPTLAMEVGEVVELSIETVYRSGYRVAGMSRASLFVDTDDVAVIRSVNGGGLQIEAIAAGTATIEVRRSESKEAKIFPTPAPKGHITVTVVD